MIKFGDWKKADRAVNARRMGKAIDKIFGRATMQNALIVQREIKEGIKNQKWGWQKNSIITTLLKRGKEKALIDRGDLFNSITIQLVIPSVAFVGVLRTAKKAGKNIFNIGAMMEKGADIVMTQKMRRYLAAQVWKRSGGKIKLDSSKAKKKGYIHIPARPFIQPAVKSALPKVNANYMRHGLKVWSEVIGR